MVSSHDTDTGSAPASRPVPGLFLTWPRATFLLLAVVVVSSLLTVGAASVFMGSQLQSMAILSDLRDEPNFHKLLQVIEIAHRRFVDAEDASVDKLLEGAITGAVEALDDRYSMYYDRSKYASMRRSMEGEYSGIGTTVTSVDGYVTIMSPFRGAPADLTPFEGATPDDPVGLQPGDRVTEVDGADIVGMLLEQATELIVGPEGTTVTLTVLRDGRAEPLTFNIERARIVVPVVETGMISDSIGYLHILQFTDHTFPQVQAAIQEMERIGARGLVLDLRNNGGGLLSSVTDVSGLLVPRGPLVHIDARDTARETLYSSGPGTDLHLVVLVNRGTASASEILAGAIRDAGVAELVGGRTFGKGSVQNVWELDENTGLKVTTARFVTPNGYSIEEEEGLQPDYEIELPPDAEFGDPQSDLQLKKAIQLVEALLER